MVKSRFPLLVPLLLITSVAVALAGYAVYRHVFNIKGFVNVPGEATAIGINMEIKEPEGEVNLTHSFYVKPMFCVQFYAGNASFEGDFYIIISGIAKLKNLDVGITYNIEMPCLIHNTECFRILKLIPGYDTPMWILPGRYDAIITLKWLASGTGTFTASLYMELTPCKPFSTD